MTLNSKILLFLFLSSLSILACDRSGSDLPTVGFVDAFEDDTIEKAKDGFLAALKEGGFSEEDRTLRVIYRNAQGNIPTLTQIVRYFVAQKVDLIASNASLSTITAVQNGGDIPIFMMVSPTPDLLRVNNAEGRPPTNLFGVGENLDYIDTSFALIPRLLPRKEERLRVGLLYNQSEPQSVSAFRKLQGLAERLDIELIARPVNATADAQLVVGALLNEDIDAFFANPDNTVFGSFETIIKACNAQEVPVFTSESGLVARGAVAAFGADIYQWGYQAGRQAAAFLRNGSTEGIHWEMVQVRRRVYRPEAAARFGIQVPANYEPVEEYTRIEA